MKYLIKKTINVCMQIVAIMLPLAFTAQAQTTTTANVTINGNKIVSVNGTAAPDRTFTFVLTEVADLAGNPKQGGYTATTTRMGTGQFSFTISNLANGTYFYKITELNDNIPGWTYDSSEYIITVTVKNGEAKISGNGEGKKFLVVLNTDSNTIHLVELEHPAGQYETAIYDSRPALIFPAGADYPAGPWLTHLAGVHSPTSRGYLQPSNGDPKQAKFNYPQGVAVTDNGNSIYIADTENHAIRRIYRDGAGEWKVELFAGAGTLSGNSGDGGHALSARLNKPVGIAVDAAEKNLYIADMNNHRIRKIDLNSKIITTVAGSNTLEPVSGGNDGVYPAGTLSGRALFNYPSDVAIDNEGNLYIADQSNNRIKKIDPTLSEIRTIFGNGAPGSNATMINQPRGVEVDRKTGVVYASDTKGARILKLTPSSGFAGYTMSVFAGTGSAGPGPMGSIAGAGSNYRSPMPEFPVATATINNPRGLSIDNSGNLYFADEYNGCVRVVTTDGLVKVITGNGWEAGSSAPPDGVYAPGWEMYEPMGVYFFETKGSGNITFTNAYTKTPDPVNVSIKAKKVVSGAGIPGSWSFTFNMFNANATAVQGTAIGTKIVSNSMPAVTFDLPTITAGGTYYFLMTETASAVSGWTMDTKQYHIRVVVNTDMTYTTSYRERMNTTGAWGAWIAYMPTNELSFTNMYTVPCTLVQPNPMPASICYGTTHTFNLAPATGGTGITYQ